MAYGHTGTAAVIHRHRHRHRHSPGSGTLGLGFVLGLGLGSGSGSQSPGQQANRQQPADAKAELLAASNMRVLPNYHIAHSTILLTAHHHLLQIAADRIADSS
jgi:hypothetical protein